MENTQEAVFVGDPEAAHRRIRDFVEIGCRRLSAEKLNCLSFHFAAYLDEALGLSGPESYATQFKRDLAEERQ